MGEVTYSRGRKSVNLLEGFQASPVRPSDKGQYESEDVGMVKSSGLREGHQNFDFQNCQ
jgi:hypothetical protein